MVSNERLVCDVGGVHPSLCSVSKKPCNSRAITSDVCTGSISIEQINTLNPKKGDNLNVNYEHDHTKNGQGFTTHAGDLEYVLPGPAAQTTSTYHIPYA